MKLDCNGCKGAMVVDVHKMFTGRAMIKCPRCEQSHCYSVGGGQGSPVPTPSGRYERSRLAALPATKPRADAPPPPGGVSRPRTCDHRYPRLPGIAAMPVCSNCGAFA